MSKKIGIVTSHPDIFKNYFPTLAEPTFIPSEPSFTPDDQLAINALRALGYVVEPVIWGEEITKSSGYDLLIVRSPWDYMNTPETSAAFMRWILKVESIDIKILNSPALMHWLLDKHYLRDLENQGIDVIPTNYLKAGTTFNLAAHFDKQRAFVLKPCVSAGGKGLYYIKSLVDAKLYQKSFSQYLQTCDFMLQTYIPEIRTKGEWSLVFIGGEYSHSLHKKPAKNSILVHAERGGLLDLNAQPEKHIIEFAYQAYARIIPAFQEATHLTCHPHDILYLRLDIIDTAYGPVLIECEGVEPELFFRAKPESVLQFSSAVTRAMHDATV